MKRRPLATAVLGLGCAAFAASACGSLLPQPVPSKFYVLSASAANDGGAPLSVALGVGPVQIPAYLDRPQIATRTGPNQIAYAELERWATPLQQGVTNALMANLGARLGTERLSTFPFALGVPRDYDVSLEIFYFESSASGEVRVDALWRIRDVRNGTELVARRSNVTGSAPAGDYAAASAALSDALGGLADEIAGALRQAHVSR